MTGKTVTVVTRESPWDDTTRDRALRHAEYQRSICQCGCGQPIHESVGKKQPWVIESYVCQAGRALAIHERKEAERAKAENKPEGWDDGLHYQARPFDPDDRDAQSQPKGAERAAPTRDRKRRL